MSSEQPQTPQGESSEETTAKKSGQELIDAFTHLAKQLGEVAQMAWNSEQRKKLEEDISAGLVKLADTLESGLKRVAESKEAQELRSAAEDVAEKVRSSKFAADLGDTLAQGLRAASERLDKLAEEMRKHSAESAGKTADAPQDIPIDKQDKA